MVELLSLSTSYVLSLISYYGYVGVFILSLLDRLTVFLIPGEIILPAFGILVSRGDLNFVPVFGLVTVGSFFGNLILYFIFFKGGRPFLENYGRFFLISKHDLQHLDRWFPKYGGKLVFVGYLLPTSIRSLVPIVAGISKMKFFKFSLYTLIGSLPYNLLLLYAGMKAGSNLEEIFSLFGGFNYVILAVLVILIVWYIIRHIRGKHLTHD